MCARSAESTLVPEIILGHGARTPFGDFGNPLRDTPLTELGVHATSAALCRSNLPPGLVDHLVFGNVLPVGEEGHFVSRRVALEAGLPVGSSALTINRGCASGSDAIATAAGFIADGDAEIAVAAGGENFCRVAHVLGPSRWNPKHGPLTLSDAIDSVYRSPSAGELMVETAELLAERFGYDRASMDAWALASRQRAAAAINSGFLARQIEPLSVSTASGSELFAVDELVRRDTTAEALARLRPSLKSGGAVTAGNSCAVTDGAAAIVVARRATAERNGIKPCARLVAFATTGVAPDIIGAGSVAAITTLLARTGLSVDDIDYWEIDEAFAAVNLHVERQLGVPHDMTNLYGGALSLGHPPGATGIRMTLTAIDHLHDTGGRYAVISMCAGGGQGMATLIERV
jgi:acetyl-CoA acetyltransferase family protein